MDEKELEKLLDIPELLEFSKKFRKEKDEERLKLPFHLNLVDQLHINENAHSRVLTHLLSYKNEDRQYVYLTSLIDLIKEKQIGDFSNITIVSPEITQEKERIDLWVRDKKYAIIFENKIYNATDREAQLGKYIKKTLKHDYNENQIFVIYLSQFPKEPDMQSWGEYKEKFRSRYVNLSYCYDILPWLKDKVLPNIKYKELFLQTAIIQYIDYLEGLFKIRKIDKPMNIKVKELIEQHFKLSDKSTKEKIQIIQKLVPQIDTLSFDMKALSESYRQKIFENWRKETEKYSKFRPNQTHGRNKWYITDVTFDNIDGIQKTAVVYIGCDETLFYSGFYFDFDLPDQDRELRGPIVERLKEHLPGTNHVKQMFKSFDNNQFDEVYQHFEETIAIVRDYSKI